MSMLSKDQIKEMIQQYDIKTTEDIKNAFKDMFGEVVQEIMEAELDTYLGYEKHSKESFLCELIKITPSSLLS